ncbi:MAG: histidinol dehydrogenase [Dehalococcoidia bacterium]
MKRITGLAAALGHFRGAALEAAADLPPAVQTRVREVFGEDLDAEGVAARVIADVRRHGDEAVLRLSGQIDGRPLAFIEVPRTELDAAPSRIPAETRAALEMAAERVGAFQAAAMPSSWHDEEQRYGEIVTPLRRVGAYVPGGTAPLASTVIMTAVPARVAGVDEVVLTSPAPGDALPHPAVLAAAKIAGVDRVFKIGGAQAVAALAFGTETVPAVDLVCGPGNVFVTAAKRQLFGRVGIDGLYGPTETLVVADDGADPEFCAADLLAQAEHDVMARPLLVTTSAGMADRVEAAMARMLGAMPRKEIASQALEHNGAAVIVDTVEEAIEVANAVAPEHLCLAVDGAERYVPLVRNAGGLFIGEFSAEVMGDYVAGPSHVMPTGGTARFASALSVRHFLRFTPLVDLDEDAFLAIARQAADLARTEHLQGHAEAAEVRLRRLLGE